jgi:hypothetical protein
VGSKRNRNERKQRAAEQREVQRRKDKRQRRIVYGIAGPVALAIIAVVPITSWYHAHQRGIQHSVGYVREASAAAKAAGCTGVRNDKQIPTRLVEPGTTVDYAALTKQAGQSLPPTSGPRESNPLPDTPTFYAYKDAPRPERAVGNLNHGYVVVWYDRKLPSADVKALQTASTANTRTLMVPWTRSVFPGDQHVVLTAWDRTQRCTKVSPEVIAAFAATYRDDASGQGWASPTAPTPNGSAGTASPNPSASPTATPAPSATTTPAPAPAPAGPSPTPSPIPSTTYSPTPVPGISGPRVTVTPIR